MSRYGASLLGMPCIERSAERLAERGEVDLREPRLERGHQFGDLPALDCAKLMEQLRDLGISVLRGLELEDAVARAEFQVERQRPQEVLQSLVKASLLAELAEAAA